VSARITGSRGHDSIAAFDSDNLAVFYLAPPDTYQMEIVHQGVVLDCSDRELPVMPEDDESEIRRIGCPPLPHRQAPEMVLMATTGEFEIKPDTVRLEQGQLFRFFGRSHPNAPLPDVPGMVVVEQVSREPEVLRCLHGDWYRAEWRSWRFPPTCPSSRDWLLVTEELREKLVRIVPCVAQVPLSADPSYGSGASVRITDCVQASLVKTDFGPGIEWERGQYEMIGLRATGCGSTWVSMTKQDSGGTQWPEPFPSYDRMEVEIAC